MSDDNVEVPEKSSSRADHNLYSFTHNLGRKGQSMAKDKKLLQDFLLRKRKKR